MNIRIIPYIYERYDSKTGKGIGVAGFGWSSTFTIAYILDWDNDNLTRMFPKVKE